MIHAYWNSLRVHDEVFVHDDDDRGFAILPGRIAFVSTETGGSNTVTVRVTALDGTKQLLHPTRLAVHLDRVSHDDECWRCVSMT